MDILQNVLTKDETEMGFGTFQAPAWGQIEVQSYKIEWHTVGKKMNGKPIFTAFVFRPLFSEYEQLIIMQINLKCPGCLSSHCNFVDSFKENWVSE